MKDSLLRFISMLTLEHVIITFIALLSSILASRKDESPPIPRALNTLSGFCTACLAGYMLLEEGRFLWATGGLTYLLGSVGYHIMNGFLTLAKQWAVDPLSTTGRIINLIWSWRIPPKR